METKKAIEILKRILQGNMEYDLAIRTAIEIMEASAERDKADGCTGCAFVGRDEDEFPCIICKRNHSDFWRMAKETAVIER